MTLAAAHMVYLMAAVACAIAVHVTPWLDLRGVGRIRRRLREPERDEADFEEFGEAREIERLRQAAARADRLAVMPRADLVFLTAAGGVLGLGLWAAAGFAGPRVITAMFEAAPARGAEGLIGAPILERTAQIIGALCAAAIGLRVFRITLAIAALGGLAGAAYLCVQFALGRAVLIAAL